MQNLITKAWLENGVIKYKLSDDTTRSGSTATAVTGFTPTSISFVWDNAVNIMMLDLQTGEYSVRSFSDFSSAPTHVSAVAPLNAADIVDMDNNRGTKKTKTGLSGKKLVMAGCLVVILISISFARMTISPSQSQPTNAENIAAVQNGPKNTPTAATSEGPANAQNPTNESATANSQPQPEQSPAAETKPQQTAAESKPTEQPQSQPSEQEAAPARPAKQESPSVSAIVSQIIGGKTTPPQYSEGSELYKKARAEADSMTPSEALNKSDEYISNTNDAEKRSPYRIVQIAFLESAAARGMKGAIAHLARFYDGKDDEKYIAWAKYGANLGDSSSINRLAYSYERGYNGLQKNLQTALKLAEAAKAAAKSGSTEELEANMLVREIKGQIEDGKLGISGN